MASKLKLGINIDHVATIRNARGGLHPDPIKAALIAQSAGADNITAHLREDRRHISDIDIKKLVRKLRIPLNLEMAPTKEMLKIAINSKVKRVCLVPEKRKEITTEGGLNISKNKIKLKKIIDKLKKNKIRVSLFIEPKVSDINKSLMLGVNCVELHTGKFCSLINKGKKSNSSFNNLKKVSLIASRLGLEVHAGHGLTFKSAKKLSKIKNISEFNIGHFLIAESLFISLSKSVRKFKKLIS